MRLIDADELIKQGWILKRHGRSNCLIGTKSIADVPTAFDPDYVVKQLDRLYDDVLKEYRNMYAGTHERSFAYGQLSALEMVTGIIKDNLYNNKVCVPYEGVNI